MLKKFKETLKDKIHILFVVVMIVYLSALAIKTCRLYWEEFHKPETTEQTAGQGAGDREPVRE